MRAVVLAILALAPIAAADPQDIVANGSFERSGPSGEPEGWSTAGHPDVRQKLTLDGGREGGHAAKLECTAFSGDSASHHVMLCQIGHVTVRRGQRYRLVLWTRAEGIRAGSVEIGLSDMRKWEEVGLSGAFPTTPRWERSEFSFLAKKDLPAADSRLQIWFKGTGTLWVDDVSLTEAAEGEEWLPAIAGDGVKNLLPNSSFECAGAGWGSYTWGFNGWEGNLYRLEGDIDGGQSSHGTHSLKIALRPGAVPIFSFDYYDPVRRPIRRVLAANLGWFRIRAGEKLTISAFLKADAPETVALLAGIEPHDRVHDREARVGTEWSRHEFTFAPAGNHVFASVGLDLDASRREAATLWIDAVQLERGERATAYEPRRPVESFAVAGAEGNTFVDPARGADLAVVAFNDSAAPQTVRGDLTLTDFLDRPAFGGRQEIAVAPRSGARLEVTGVCRGRRGFFRAAWSAGEAPPIRLAIIDSPAGLEDSPFGFNHAYPWDWLVGMARRAGIVWWRDWSAKWQTVEAEKGRLDFRAADEQIDRVRGAGSQPLVLIPFPSALWSTAARMDEVEKAAGGDSYLRARLPVSFAPRDREDFGRFAAAVVTRYRQEPRPIGTFQVLNEPVYTDYALPHQFGYSVGDYIDILAAAHRAMKAADPRCRIVAGMGAGIDTLWTREFIEKGGLRYCDVFDIHIYDPARPAESYEESFDALEKRMDEHGGRRPVWITEWGCYADDDPACLPKSIGDSTMNRCGWPSERAAAEHIVEFFAVGAAHGLRKVFFHAGTCGAINGPDAGGVLFEYGGAPRKMLPAVAALTRLLGVPDKLEKKVDAGAARAYVFRCGDRSVAVVWGGEKRPLPAGVRAFDVMGNEVPANEINRAEDPVYLVGPDLAALEGALPR